MNRRDALKYTALSLGYALTATTASAILHGCTADSAPDWLPSTLTDQQIEALSAIAETMLPTTESSPGAKDVFVHRFIDELMTNWASEETRSKWLADFDELHTKIGGNTEEPAFHKMSAEEQHEVLSTLNTEALTAENPEPHEVYYKQLKGMIIGAYFTSEQIGKEVMAYDPIPGAYEGCIPYEEGDKAWSL